ncbi:MAG: hypothetical protein A4S09_05475 [Proteobacteria bacterium SG_bin7]|nr:MAG: hypothetical protein A4S09_05475 [Proteobacteria bacterium SG_bin7]
MKIMKIKSLFRNSNIKNRTKILPLLIFLALIISSSQGCNGYKTTFDGNGDFSSLGVGVNPIATGLRRLTVEEANLTILRIFKDTTGPATKFIPEDDYGPFDNDYRTQENSEVFVRGAEFLAIDVSRRLIADTARLNSILSCTTKDAACFTKFVQTIGQKAYRRPLTSNEMSQVVKAAAALSVFNDKIDLSIRLFLQSPYFWVKSETAQRSPASIAHKITSVELASRVSYFVTGASPDDQLLQAGISGNLVDANVLRAQTERLLATTDALNQTDRMHAMWLGYNKMQLTPTLISSMRAETRDLIKKVLFDDNLPWVELLKSNKTYIDDSLAVHYGLPVTGTTGKHWIQYPASSGRQGILSHGTFLSAAGKFGGTSPTQRGYHIRKNLFCQKIAPPPPDVSADDPPPATDEAKCKIARYKALTLQPGSSCVGCHMQMDPIGFGLENFTASGQFIKYEAAVPECEIEGQGALPGIGSFSGPRELSNLMIQEGSADSCLVTRVIEFAFGRRINENDQYSVEYVENMVRKFSSHSNYKQLIVDIVTSPEFSIRRVE